jgi:hypothetical protein
VGFDEDAEDVDRGRRLSRLSGVLGAVTCVLGLAVVLLTARGESASVVPFFGAGVTGLLALAIGVVALRRGGDRYAWFGTLVGGAIFVIAALFFTWIVWAATHGGYA